MTTKALKLFLVHQIEETNNVELLQKLRSVVDNEVKLAPIYILSEGERNAVERGLSDIKNGRFVDSEEAEIEIEAWFKR